MFVNTLVVALLSCIAMIEAQFSFEEVLPAACQSQSLYFDFGILDCRNCSTGQEVDLSGFTCKCQSTYAKNVNSPRILNCQSCNGNGTTPDGYFCAVCADGSATTAGSCSCASEQPLSISYSGTGTATTSCSTCSENFLANTGSDSCSPCPDCASVCSGLHTGGLCFTNQLVTNLGLSEIPTSAQSTYINDYLTAAYGACRADESGIKNQTACGQLANLCVMEQYSQEAPSCVQFAAANDGAFETASITEWRTRLMPWLYYDTAVNQDILFDDTISQTYNFNPDVLLDLVVAQYRANGTYMGMQSVQNGLIQLCPDKTATSNAAYQFGTHFQSSCNLAVSDLSLSDSGNIYYSMYLRYTSTTGTTTLHPVPVLVSNYDSGDGNVNQETDTTEWQLVTRFFLVDTESLATTSIQYAQSMELAVELKPEDSTGSIYPPLLRITYATIAATSEDTVPASFNVIYKSSTADQREGLMISLSVLGVLAVLYAVVEASGWRRRQGLLYIEFTTIIHCIVYAMANVANMFFIVMFGYTIVLLLYFKGQVTASIYVPLNDSSENRLFYIFIATGFAFKVVHIVVIIFNQSFIDIFFIDWERPRAKQGDGNSEKVSIWRTYFVANEWNEIQTCRKVNMTLQLFIVVFFLEVVGFKNLATMNASSALNPSSDTYQPGYSNMLRFAVSTLVFLIVELVQVIYFKLIQERFISDQMRDFVDLCSVSNVSVFILSQKAYGYYIHGRSVHGKADTDMAEMNLMMKREENDLVPKRGLQTGSDQQVFEMQIPDKMRNQYNKIYEPLLQFRAQRKGGAKDHDHETVIKNLKAYGLMKNFLTSFLDHSLKDLEYAIKEKMFLEKILGMELRDQTDLAYFTIGSEDAFSDILFYGNEVALFIFDVLLFSVVDFGSQNFFLAASITYIIGSLLRVLRNQLSRHNLANKTLIDKRFLI